MNPDELRAAAERLIAYVDGLPCPAVTYLAARAIARAYLDDHFVDDGEPVTEEWLRAVLPRQYRGHYEAYFLWHEDDGWGAVLGILQINEGVWWAECRDPRDEYHNGVPLGPVPTRGHVRRLCAALGIDLKEQP